MLASVIPGLYEVLEILFYVAERIAVTSCFNLPHFLGTPLFAKPPVVQNDAVRTKTADLGPDVDLCPERHFLVAGRHLVHVGKRRRLDIGERHEEAKQCRSKHRGGKGKTSAHHDDDHEHGHTNAARPGPVNGLFKRF